jgi:tRNA(Arg) A34 adenosine deaminase TadA
VPVWSRHAEIGVIRWVYKKYGAGIFPECSIYVHRKGGKVAKPCAHCAQVINMMGFKEVIWSKGDLNKTLDD